MNIKQRLTDNGYELPQAPAPVGNYQATITTGNLMFVSGQMPLHNGNLLYKGSLGNELTIESGQKAAELCALNLLSQIDQSLEGRELKSVVKVEGYINADESFTEHAAVLNGASDLLYKVLGERSGHIRTVIGCTSLPMGAAVEISAIVEVI